MDVWEILSKALVETGDNPDDLVCFKDSEHVNAFLSGDVRIDTSLNRDPDKCSVEELVSDADNPPSFIAFSKKFIYFFMNYGSSEPEHGYFFKVIPRAKTDSQPELP